MKEIVDRRSVRKFSDKKVSDELVLKLIESARLAPSGSNTQPWRFKIIDDKNTIEKFSIINNNQAWIKDASHLIICLCDASSRFENVSNVEFNEDSSDFAFKQIIRDTSIAITHILLEAQHLDLGTCLVAWYDQNAAKELFSIPKYQFIVGVIVLGYALEKPVARPRLKLEDIIEKP